MCENNYIICECGEYVPIQKEWRLGKARCRCGKWVTIDYYGDECNVILGKNVVNEW